MGSSESGSASGQAEMRRASATASLDPGGSRPRPHGQVWAIALAAGVAAGLGSWLASEMVYELFKPRLFAVESMGIRSMQPSRESQIAADSKNAMLVFAILGGVTGLAFGFAGGLAGRSPSWGVIVGLGGLTVGVLVGGLVSLGLIPLFYRHLVPDTNDLLSPVLIHGGIWTAIGAVGGLAFALGTRSRRRFGDAIAGACFGAFLATILFHALSGAFFLDSRSTEPVASMSIVRLLGMGLISVLVAVGTVRGAQGGFLHPASSLTDN